MKQIVSDVTRGKMRNIKLEFVNGYGIELVCNNLNESLSKRKWNIQVTENKKIIDLNKTSYFNKKRNPVIRNCDQKTTTEMILKVQDLPMKGTFDIAI